MLIWKKCVFFINYVIFLGFMGSSNEIYIDEEKVRAVQE